MDWISVEDELPYHKDIVLVCDKYNDFVSLGKFIENEDTFEFILMYIDKIEFDSVITHWMPRPKPPKDE